jgi:hypothetical protein
MKRKILRAGAVPSQFPWTMKLDDSRSKRLQERKKNKDTKRRKLEAEFLNEDSSITECHGDPQTFAPPFKMELDFTEEEVVATSLPVTPVETTSVGVQTEETPCECQLSTSTTQEELPEEPVMKINEFVEDSRGLMYYTGCESLARFYSILKSLGPAAHCLTYWDNAKPDLCIEDQFLLTLMKLRTYQPNYELSRYFSISEQDVYCIFVTWVRFVALQ